MHHTALHDWHVAHGGRMVDFAGWHMPVQYTTVVEEHRAVRARAGVFDIAHMGRLEFTGPDACRFLDSLLTNNVSQLKVGQIRYALLCNEQGGILDDVLVYRFADRYQLVVNASNREKIVAWVDARRGGFDVEVRDRTLETFMLALQGPRALELITPLTDADVGEMKYYSGREATTAGIPSLISRTGYTGEDGVEVIVSRDDGPPLWDAVMAAGRNVGLLPCGLGSRDTLRLEAGMPLYGHELDEATDPLTAGLGFAVKLQAAEFIGRPALQVIESQPTGRTRVGLVLEGRRIARDGAPLFDGDEEVGRVTSGTFSPTLEASIAMGYVRSESSQVETALTVEIRGQRIPAKVVPLPFYSRS